MKKIVVVKGNKFIIDEGSSKVTMFATKVAPQSVHQIIAELKKLKLVPKETDLRNYARRGIVITWLH